jgi:hypothetical protein
VVGTTATVLGSVAETGLRAGFSTVKPVVSSAFQVAASLLHVQGHLSNLVDGFSLSYNVLTGQSVYFAGAGLTRYTLVILDQKIPGLKLTYHIGLYDDGKVEEFSPCELTFFMREALPVILQFEEEHEKSPSTSYITKTTSTVVEDFQRRLKALASA